jgi:hypothetical protein
MRKKTLLLTAIPITLFCYIPAFCQNIGIGTTTPNMGLHVRKAHAELLQLENTGALATNSELGLYFKNGNYFTGAVKTIGNGAGVARLSFFTFAHIDQDMLKERMSIFDDGSVGIGTTTPYALLDVRTDHTLPAIRGENDANNSQAILGVLNDIGGGTSGVDPNIAVAGLTASHTGVGGFAIAGIGVKGRAQATNGWAGVFQGTGGARALRTIGGVQLTGIGEGA